MSGMLLLKNWFKAQSWSDILTNKCMNKKAELLLSSVLEALNKCLPEKVLKVSSDDEPWYTPALKKLDRKRRREYSKNRKSPKYLRLSRLYQEKLFKEKKKYKKDMLDDIKSSQPGEWYSKLKRITKLDQGKLEVYNVEEISNLNDQKQAELISDHHAKISNCYEGVKLEDIDIPPFSAKDIPQFTPIQIESYIQRLKTKKSTPPGDIPSKIIKEFSKYLSIPLSNIINSSLSQGTWPDCYKKEVITPIPKERPVLLMSMLRPISSLLSFNKVQEMVIVDMVVSDMTKNLDPTQYGNRKATSIQHYLVRKLRRILSQTDGITKGETRAVLCTLIDWQKAYSRQSHIPGVRSFSANGVCPSLLSLLTSYFMSREMRIKWHGKLSKPQPMPGSGAMGSSLGNWEFDSQTNNNADCVPEQDRYKFIDDLTVLEIVSLIKI